MAADPEPCDFTFFEQAYRSVSQSDAHRVDRLPSVNLLELQLGWLGFSRNSRYALREHLGQVQEGRRTPSRSAESRASSQAVWIDVRRTAAGLVGARFSGELAEQVLRRFKLPGPLLVVREFVKQPAADTVLFVRRKRRQLRDRGVQRAVMIAVYRMSVSRPSRGTQVHVALPGRQVRVGGNQGRAPLHRQPWR